MLSKCCWAVSLSGANHWYFLCCFVQEFVLAIASYGTPGNWHAIILLVTQLLEMHVIIAAIAMMFQQLWCAISSCLHDGTCSSWERGPASHCEEQKLF